MGCVQPPLRIERLSDHPEAIATLTRWFESEWASYYGPDGPGDAASDLEAYAGRGLVLPVGLIAYRGDELCGIMALKAASISTHPHLGPWAAAGLVPAEHRGQGIGAELLRAVERLARGLGHTRLYCGTYSSVRLLLREGWTCIDRVDDYHGEDVSIFEKALR
jgi:GNAT superfamily N-acetyltransferase